LTATKGWAATEVEETLARGRVLAEQLGRPEHLVRLILGQWSLHHVRSEHRLALPLAEHLQQIGEMRNDAGQSLSRYAQGVTRLTLGEFVAARALLERYRDLAEPTDRFIGGLSFDPQTATSAYLALTLTCLGYIDQARSRKDEALSKAHRLNHVHTLAHELCLQHYFDWLTCSPMLHTEELLALSAEHGFPYFLGWGLIFRGRSLITLGQAREGLALLIQGLAHVRATGAILYKPMLLTWLSEAHAILGRFLEAQKYLAETAQFVETTEERAYAAELLHRVPGDLLNAAGDLPAAEQHYRQAIVVAERQSARLFQLRASVSLARLWRDQGNRAKARDLLGPIYNWFNEGFDAPDLKEAKALLDELA
jgi:tetratricopeptide (TPR) repeat protein